MAKLNAFAIYTLHSYCLFDDSELITPSAGLEEILNAVMDSKTIAKQPPPNAIQAETMLFTWFFHPERLEEKRQEVMEMLSELPLNMALGSNPDGIPCSMLNRDSEGNEWGDTQAAERLLSLAAGLKLVEYLPPQYPKRNMPSVRLIAP